MKPLTYGELLAALNELSPEQLQMSASIYQDGEILPIFDTVLVSEFTPDSKREELLEVIEENQPLLRVDGFN